MKDPRLLRDLPAYLLDLLEPARRLEIDAALGRDESLRLALTRMSERAADAGVGADHLDDHDFEAQLAGVDPNRLEHILDCRECSFKLSVALASRMPRATGRTTPARRTWVPSLAVAAVVLMLVGGWEIGRRGAPREDTSPVAAPVVYLSLQRGVGSEQPVLSVRESGSTIFTCVVEVRSSKSKVEWELRDFGGTVVGQGSAPLGAGPLVRPLALTIDVSRLPATQNHFVLEVREPDDVSLGHWTFTIVR